MGKSIYYSKDRSINTRIQIEQSPNLLEEVCASMVNGANIIDLCAEKNLDYGTFMLWIHNDKQRENAFNKAMDDRNCFYVQQIINELQKIMTLDVVEIFKESGAVKGFKDIPKDISLAIKNIKVQEIYNNEGENIGCIKSIEFHDKIKALEMLGKSLQMFIERRDINIKSEITHKVEEIDIEERIKGLRGAGGSLN